MNVLRSEVDRIQVYSIDEAFFELKGECVYEEAARIQKKIEQCVGVPVTIGIGQTKTIAKAASEVGKKNREGVCVFSEDRWKEMRVEFPLHRVWGIGRQMSAACYERQVRTVEEYLALDPTQVQSLFGINGVRKQSELRGVVMSKVGDERASQKSIMSSRSFKSPLYELGQIEEQLTFHVEEVCQSLRKDGLLASVISVSLSASRHGDFVLRGGVETIELEVPTSETSIILQNAKKILSLLYEPQVPFKKVGIVVSDLLPAQFETNSLFANNRESVAETKSVERIGKIIDTLNDRFRNTVITVGRTPKGDGARFREKELLSPAYTTSANDIKTIKAL